MNVKLLLSLVSATVLANLDLVCSQVVEDDTLSTEVTQTGDRNIRVTGGEQRGDNLFHSFEQFSIVENGTVLFDNALTIQNIIGRVTGSSISQIDGLIQNNGTANLFLLNPNGIIFSDNARLDLGGSFVGTTAESLLFKDGSGFSTSPDNSELLTISTPLGLQFGSDAGSIINRANLSLSDAPGDRTFALLGNGITFDGGTIAVPGGSVELGSIAENSFVALNKIEGWQPDYSEILIFSDLKLDNLAVLDTSGAGGGRINVTGNNIEILNGSGIKSNTLGSLDGKSINVRAANLVKIDGSDRTGTQIDPILTGIEIFVPLASQISSNTSGSGKAGDINLTAKNLQISDGGSIELLTLPTGTGNGGNLSIAIKESIEMKGFRPLLSVGANAANLISPGIGIDRAIELNQASEISTATINNGKGGDISIVAQNLRLEDGSLIGVSPFASGDGGNINLNISELLEIKGVSPRSGNVSSLITANTFASGNAGRIDLTVGELRIADGGQLVTTTTTAATGNSGDIKVKAGSVILADFNDFGQISSKIAAETLSEGKGGNIVLETGRLEISDRALISVRGSSWEYQET